MTVDTTKEEILAGLLRVLVIVGGIAYLPRAYLSFVSGLHVLVALDSLVYGLLIVVTLARRMRYQLRLSVLVAESLLLGAVLFFVTGPYGSGYIYLIAAIFVAALPCGRHFIAWTVAATLAIAVAYALFLAPGHPAMGQPLGTFLVTAANLVLVCLLLGIATRHLIKSLEAANEKEVGLTLRVSQELEATRATEQPSMRKLPPRKPSFGKYTIA